MMDTNTVFLAFAEAVAASAPTGWQTTAERRDAVHCHPGRAPELRVQWMAHASAAFDARPIYQQEDRPAVTAYGPTPAAALEAFRAALASEAQGVGL